MHVPRIVRRVDGHFENKFDMRNQDFQRWIPEILREWTICERISQDCGDKQEHLLNMFPLPTMTEKHR